MEAKDHLQSLKDELDSDKHDLEQIDILIKTAKDAGELVTDLEAKQRSIKASIKRWETAIANNLK